MRLRQKSNRNPKPRKCANGKLDLPSQSDLPASTLQEQISTRRNEKPFKCPHCERAFAYASYRSRHMRIHTGEKPYKCSICGRAFTQAGNRTKHMIIHTGKKPYKCTVCERGFTQASSRLRHMIIHTAAKKPFVFHEENSHQVYGYSGHFHGHLRKAHRSVGGNNDSYGENNVSEKNQATSTAATANSNRSFDGDQESVDVPSVSPLKRVVDLDDSTSATSLHDIPQTNRFKSLNGDSQSEQEEHQNEADLDNDNEYYDYSPQEYFWDMEPPIDDYNDIGPIDNYEIAHNLPIENTPNDSINDTFPAFESFPRFDSPPSLNTSSNGANNHATTIISSIPTSVALTAAVTRRSPNVTNEARQEVECEQKKDKDNRRTMAGATKELELSTIEHTKTFNKVEEPPTLGDAVKEIDQAIMEVDTEFMIIDSDNDRTQTVKLSQFSNNNGSINRSGLPVISINSTTTAVTASTAQSAKSQFVKAAKTLPPTSNGTASSSSRSLYPWSDEVRSALIETFKQSQFKPNQIEAINATLNGENAFVLMSGQGSSLCYQLPAIVQGYKRHVLPLLFLVLYHLWKASRTIGPMQEALRRPCSALL